MTLSCRLYRAGVLEDERLDPERIDEVMGEPGTLVWLDVEGPTKKTMSMLGREFGFHELALEDSIHRHQRPKIEQYDSYFFLVAYGVSARDNELIEHEMSVFVSHKFLVTVRKEPVFDLAKVIERWDAHAELAKEGGGYLLYILLDEIVDGYFNAMDLFEDRTELMEEAVLGEEASTGGEPQTEIFRLRKELLVFRRRIAPLRDVLDVMQRRIVDVVTAPLEPYYRDVYDHVLRATDFVDGTRDILSTVLDAHLAVVSNRLNVIMKHLTSYAAIILVPTLIAGIYGMNFVHMPELRWRFGYAYALGLMLVLALMLYRAFKRRDWL